MWKLLPLLVVLANLILTVTPSRDTHTVIKVTNTAEAGAAAATDGGNGTAEASAAAASSTTIIKTSHHHKKCAAHEKYVKCPEKLCQPQLCEEVGITQCSSHEKKHGKEEKNDSETDAKETCKGPAACVCKEDYVRNDDGICMPAQNCPSCGNDKNATYGCGVNCGRRCSNYDKGPVSCTEECKENSCDCKEGFVYDDTLKFCVLPEDCSPASREDTSSTTEKVGEGTTENNEDDGDDENMTSSTVNSETSEQTGSTESSVTKSTTRKPKHKTTKKPMKTSTTTSEEPDSSTKDSESETTSDANTTTEKESESSSSTETATTSKKTKKPSTTTKSSGESKHTTRKPKTLKTTTEPGEETATEGSDDSCGNDKNATRGCGVNCGRQCSTYNKGPVSCDEVCYENSCDCKEGFVFDDILRFCVLPEDCSLTSSEDSSSTTEKAEGTTESNEDDGDDENMPSSTESSVTRSTTHRPKHTTTKKPSTQRPRTTKTPKTTTESGEETTDGSDDSCGNDKNATQGCGVNCGRKCSNYEKHVSCGEVCYENGCDCREGFVFDEYIGFCVLPEDCSVTSEDSSSTTKSSGGHTTRHPKSTKSPTTTRSPKATKTPKTTTESEEETTTEGSDDSCGNDKNATQGCGVNCGRKCSNYEKHVSCGEVCYENGCDCREGFVFDEYIGFCVLPEDCSLTSEDSSLTTKSSERHTTRHPKSPTTTRRPKATKTPNTTTESEEETTTEGSDDSCGNDKNATQGCGVNCGRRCSNYDKGPVFCPAVCYENSCDCKEGFVFDDYLGFCVLPEDCSDSSNKVTEMTTEESGHEVTTKHSGTGSNTCRHKTTKRQWKTTTATTEDPDSSSEESTMTTEEETTTVRGPKDCRGRHESYYKCAPPCPQMSCNDYLNGEKCHKHSTHKAICKPECRCKAGYYKDEEENCLSKKECKRRAKSTTMASLSTTANPNNQGSTTTMMSTTPEDPNCEDVAKELFVKGNLVYTTKLLTDLSEREPRDNVLVGGASILFLISQLAVTLTSKSTLRTELLNVLNFKNTEQMCRCDGEADLSYLLMNIFKEDIVLEQIRCYMPKISANLTATYPDIDFKLFCKIYANEHYALTEDFIQSTTNIFGMGPENLNFKSPKAVKKINSDVALYTENSMLHYMKARTLKSLDGLVLVDAEEFEGIWDKQFHSSATIMKDFYTQGKIIKIPTMHSNGIFMFAHSNRLNAKVLRLNFAGGRFSLVIILPNGLDGIKDLLKKMESPENILSALDSMKHDYVKISLPKFNLSVANRLKLSSEAANLKELFTKETTALKDIGSAKPPYVGDILQKMVFKVTEYGMGNKSDMDFTKPEEITHISKYGHTHTFKVDHPFVFFLCFDDTIVVQAGLVNEQ